MIFVNYKTGFQFVEKQGDKCVELRSVDNWQDVCGCYWKDIDGNYMFLYSKENKIILEYKDRLFPLDNYSFSCVFNPIECKDSQSEPVHEIWSFQIDGDDREETILFEGELFIDEETTLNAKHLNFGQYVERLLDDNAHIWFIANHSIANDGKELYLHPFYDALGPVMRFDGNSLSEQKSSSRNCFMKDGEYCEDVEETKCMLYVEDCQYFIQYKGMKACLDDSELSLSYGLENEENQIFKLTIRQGEDTQTMLYKCFSPDALGEDEECDINWGCYLSRLKENKYFRERKLNAMMFLKKR